MVITMDASAGFDLFKRPAIPHMLTVFPGDLSPDCMVSAYHQIKREAILDPLSAHVLSTGPGFHVLPGEQRLLNRLREGYRIPGWHDPSGITDNQSCVPHLGGDAGRSAGHGLCQDVWERLTELRR